MIDHFLPSTIEIFLIKLADNIYEAEYETIQRRKGQITVALVALWSSETRDCTVHMLNGTLVIRVSTVKAN